MARWWGYIHANGSTQVKPYFSQSDLDDAAESPFVKRIIDPFDAKDREDAIAQINKARGIQ